MSTEYAGSSASFPATVTLPSDGDNKPAASVNNGLQDLADRTAYLDARIIPTSLIIGTSAGDNDGTLSAVDTFTTTSFVQATNFVRDVPNCAVGDKLIVLAQLQLDVSGTDQGRIRLFWIEDYGGGAPVTNTSLPSAARIIGSGGVVRTVTMAQVLAITSLAGTCRVGVEGRVVTGAPDLMSIYSGAINVIRVRA